MVALLILLHVASSGVIARAHVRRFKKRVAPLLFYTRPPHTRTPDILAHEKNWNVKNTTKKQKRLKSVSAVFPPLAKTSTGVDWQTCQAWHTWLFAFSCRQSIAATHHTARAKLQKHAKTDLKFHSTLCSFKVHI